MTTSLHALATFLPEPEPIAVPARGGESMAAIVARSVEAAESPGATIAPGFSAVPIDPEQRRFTGRVVDRDGGPVDDAEIRIRCMYRDELQTGPQTTRSKPDGTFAFEVDRDCSPSVRAAKGDAISRRASTLPIRARELHKEPFVLELVPVPVALFKVLDAHTGAPLAGARLSTDVFRSISAVADASGVARIPVEDYLDLQKLSRRDPTLTSFRTISIDAPGYPSVREPLFDASARLPDDDPRTVRLVRGIPVSGRVVDRDGRGIAGAYVVIEDDADSEPRTTDASGAFEVAVPRPGRYRALVVPPGRSARRGVPAIDVEIGADGTDLELPLREPERLGELTGTVVDGHGNPVTGARVRTRGRPLQSELRPVVTDARGRFSFPIWLVAPSPDENGATTVFVVATHGSLASALTPVEIRDHAQNIELTLPIGPAGIAGVVVDLDGGPVPGADVWLNFCCGKYKLIEGTRVEADAQGRFAFDVPRGEFVLSVRRSRDDDFDDRDDRTVSGGSHDVRLVVP